MIPLRCVCAKYCKLLKNGIFVTKGGGVCKDSTKDIKYVGGKTSIFVMPSYIIKYGESDIKKG